MPENRLFSRLLPRRTKTLSESSDVSESGPNLTEGVPELDVESTNLVPNRLNVTQLIQPPASSVPEGVSGVASAGQKSMPDGKEYYLYDKYLAK